MTSETLSQHNLSEELARRRSLRPKAEAIVRKRAAWGAVGGFIPIPLLDWTTVSGIQVLMIQDLCDIYRVKFSAARVRGIVSAVMGGIVPSAVKAIPGVGWILGLATAPAAFSAATYGVGRYFITHFETGGDLDNLDTAEAANSAKREAEREADEPESKPATAKKEHVSSKA